MVLSVEQRDGHGDRVPPNNHKTTHSVFKRGHYFLLQLDPIANQLKVTGFRYSEVLEASRRYAEAEKLVGENPGTDAVLVSVDSLAALERAYPNYFADTGVFLDLMHQALA
jgi:hypothetical protein